MLEQARTYERRWLVNDVTAGLVLVALLVPAGMAYAQASGLPPISGLYATVVPLLVYAVVGPSRVLVMGPDSALAPLIAAVVLPLAGRDPGRAVALAGLLALLVGLIAVLAGLARFGFLAELLSAPVRYGYLNGIALTIVVSQLPKALGFSVHAETMLGTLRGVWDGIDDGRTDGRAIAIAVVALVVIVVLRRLTPVIPGVLIVVVGAIAATVLFGFKGDGLALVGDLPSGFPTPRLPELSWSMIGRVGGAAFGIAFVAFADTSVLARVYALKRGARVDSNQELVALGVVNAVTGLFQGFPVSGSQSRTPVAEAAGARTQLTGVVAAVVAGLRTSRASAGKARALARTWAEGCSSSLTRAETVLGSFRSRSPMTRLARRCSLGAGSALKVSASRSSPTSSAGSRSSPSDRGL